LVVTVSGLLMIATNIIVVLISFHLFAQNPASPRMQHDRKTVLFQQCTGSGLFWNPFDGMYYDQRLKGTMLPAPTAFLEIPPLDLVEEHELAQDRKHFLEADNDRVGKEKSGLWHYDKRYFVKKFVNAERRGQLIEIFGAWAKFADDNRIPYWIAHGSLVGWYWGSKILPWDEDIDIQMDSDVLSMLYYNSTNGIYEISDRYFFEINPHVLLRQFLRNNVIDARVVDKETGLFIDITGLFVKAPTRSYEELQSSQFWCCKSPHCYEKGSIYPLVRVIFEQIDTWRPYNFKDCLVSEYGYNALFKQEFRNHTWRGNVYRPDPVPRKGIWMPN